MFAAALREVLGLPALFPQVLLDVKLSSSHADAILRSVEPAGGEFCDEEVVAMDLSWSRVLAFSALRAAAKHAIATTKKYMYVALRRVGRMFYGTSRSRTYGLMRHAGSYLIAETLFYPFWNEGVAFTFFRAAEESAVEEKDSEVRDCLRILNYLPLTVAYARPKGRSILFTSAGFSLYAISGLCRNFSYFFTFNVASMILGVGEGHRYDNERLHAIAYFAAWGTSVTVSHLVFCPIDTLRRQLVLQEVLNYQDKRNGRVFKDGVFDTAMKMWHSGGIAQSYHNLRTSVPAALLSYVLIAASFRIQRLLFSRQS